MPPSVAGVETIGIKDNIWENDDMNYAEIKEVQVLYVFFVSHDLICAYLHD